MKSVTESKTSWFSVVPPSEVRKGKRMNDTYVILTRIREQPSSNDIEKGIKSLEQNLKDEGHLIEGLPDQAAATQNTYKRE